MKRIIQLLCIITILLLFVNIKLNHDANKINEPYKKYTGYTKIRYGIGITNKGDTIHIKPRFKK